MSAWKATNASLLDQATTARNRSQEERAQASAVIRTNTAELQRTQREVQNKLALRIDDIELRKRDLTASIEAAEAEIGELSACKQQVETIIQEKEQPIAVVVECQRARQGRQPPDLVVDDVDKKLAQELAVLQQAQEAFRGRHAAIVEQLRLLRASVFQLREDLKDKSISHSIDATCAQLDTSRADLGLFRESVRLASADRALSPEEWDHFTLENIAKCGAEIQKSAALRDDVNELTKNVAHTTRAAGAAVEEAFNARLAEYNEARTEATQQLAKLQQETALQDRAIFELRDTLASRDAPLKLATTRLDKRTLRPNVEFVKDPAQLALVKEVDDLDQSVAQLSARLGQAEDVLKGLLRSKVALEADVACKVNSINIDNACMMRRQQLKYAAL